MSEPTRVRRQLRWWLLALILVAAAGAYVTIPMLPIHDELQKETWAVMAPFIGAGLIVLWVLLFSGLSWVLRVSTLLVAVLGLVTARRLLPQQANSRMEMRGWDPRLLADPPEPEDQSAPDYALPMVKVADGATTRPVDLKTTTPQDYPRFLGADGRDVVNNIVLSDDWKTDAPKPLWRQPIGAGLSAFSIVGDYAVTQEQRGSYELVTCYDLKTGEPRWVHQDKIRFSESQGGDGPRATPTIYDGKVYSMGARGILNCLDGATGNVIWTRNILIDYKENNLNWGKSCSPLVFDNLVVVGLGDAPRPSLAAYNRQTGEEVWSSGHDTATYASPVLATIAGVRQVISVNTGTVTGHDPADGHIIWEYGWQGAIHCSQPVPLPEDRVFVSCEYGVGSAMIQIKAANGGLTATELWRSPRMQTKFTNVVHHDGYIYGLDGGILACMDAKTGKQKWKGERYGMGQILLVNDQILVMGDDGTLTLVAADPTGPHVLANMSVLKGRTWNNIALSGKYLAVRNTQEAACYELPLKSGKNIAATTASR